MTRTENDYYKYTQNGTNARKDFDAHIPRYLSKKITIDSHGFQRPNFDAASFIVDWQLSIEDNSDIDKGHF